MRMMVIFWIATANAGFVEIPDPPPVSRPRTIAKPSPSNLKKILEQDREIIRLLLRKKNDLIIKKSSEKIVALSRLRGIILNSILATNTGNTTFIVRLEADADFVGGGELRCSGSAPIRRILSSCDLLVVDGREYPVHVDIRDVDGAEGIIPDHHYSGEEKRFATSALASFFGGVLDAAKERIATPYGKIDKRNTKNKILNGLTETAKNAESKIRGSGERVLSISYVHSGKAVLVFFNKTLELEGEP